MNLWRCSLIPKENPALRPGLKAWIQLDDDRCSIVGPIDVQLDATTTGSSAHSSDRVPFTGFLLSGRRSYNSSFRKWSLTLTR
jgi:hypothetical protein